MSYLLMRDRLEALGYDLDTLPPIAPCSCEADPDCSFDVFAGAWTVWCLCGRVTEPQTSLVTAIRQWNDMHGHPTPETVETGEVANG